MLDLSIEEKLFRIFDQAVKENKKELDLSYMDLTEVPSDIGNLQNLRTLDLRGNQLTRLPYEISKLTNLSVLTLGANQFSLMPPEIFSLKNLTVLHLRGNKLTVLSSKIGNLTNLEILYLGENNISKIPEEITHLQKLRHLELRNNCLKNLPTEIGKLTNLSVIDLRDNELTELPVEINGLKNLSRLDVGNNMLTNLPAKIGTLPRLRMIGLQLNPIPVPPEILAQETSEIINYLSRHQTATSIKKINEAKLLVVGQGGVGKTCLMKRLMFDTYDKYEETTEGIRIHKWQISSPQDTKTAITLNVWDFGGQEIYHATHQFFLTQRSLYIFVWDARQEEEYSRIDYWLNIVESFSDNSPIIIVLNKSDERVKELNLKEFRERFPQIIGSHNVSCLTGDGIKELTNIIQNSAWKLPLMNTSWLPSWLEVRKRLENDSRNYIYHREYMQLTKECGLSDLDASSLSKYLHDLGIILHFHKDIILKDIVILKPEWGTNAVYKVLDSRLIQERDGLLLNEDLSDIWKDLDIYPPETYSILLKLMSKFELAFQLPDGNKNIVAELLPNKELEFEWNNKDNLQFEYHYDFLPAGIMTRCIVRLHQTLMKKDGKNLSWREGAYFTHENTKAFMKIFPLQKRIVIKIEGKKKREFLAIIRHQVDEIHSTIKKIRVKEKIPCCCEPNCQYRFDYRILLRREEKRNTIDLCGETDNEVNISNLLNGIELASQRQERREEMAKDGINIRIENKPHVQVDAKSQSVALSRTEISNDVKNSISFIQGSFADLKDEVLLHEPSLQSELDKLEESIEKLGQSTSKEDIIKSGALSKINRFLQQIDDTSTTIGKVVDKIKGGIGIAKDIAKYYNNVAQWCGLPPVPGLFL